MVAEEFEEEDYCYEGPHATSAAEVRAEGWPHMEGQKDDEDKESEEDDSEEEE
jgi:hypothetical protein